MRYAFYNVGYLDDTDVRIWSSMAYWRAEEALFLSLNICPEKDGAENDESNAREIGRDYQVMGKIVERARSREELKYVETPCWSDGADGTEVNVEISYVPHVYVKWAIGRLPNFPIKLYKAIKERYPDEFVNATDPCEITQEKPEAILRSNQKAKERCQAIAEMLWDQDSSIKVKEMIERDEIQKYGQGSFYEKSTIYDWVTEVSPKNRSKQKQVSGEDSA